MAREALYQVEEIAIGNGLMEKEPQQRVLREWRRLANENAPGGKRPRVQANVKDPRTMERMGIQVTW